MWNMRLIFSCIYISIYQWFTGHADYLSFKWIIFKTKALQCYCTVIHFRQLQSEVRLQFPFVWNQFCLACNGQSLLFPIPDIQTNVEHKNKCRAGLNFVHGEVIVWLWFAIGQSHVSDKLPRPRASKHIIREEM